MIQDMASVQQQEGYFRDLVERLVHQFEVRAHYDDEVAIIREAREALAHNETPEAVSKPDSTPQAGNAAKMRMVLDGIGKLCKHNGNDFGSCVVRELLDLLDMIGAAAQGVLAVPARNCDRYDVEDGATACMQAIDAAWHEIDTIRATIGWMLAPAEGKEASNV